MKYPIPLQVHVVWHPDADAVCRPLAERIYLALNRDLYQPLIPGIGIPVFFRCAGAHSDNPRGSPRPITVSDTRLDLRIALVTAEFLMDAAWMAFLEESSAEIARAPRDSALALFDLSHGAMEGERLAIRLDPSDARTPDQLMQHVILQCCRLLASRPRNAGGETSAAAPLRLFLSHTKRDPDGLSIAKAVKRYLDELAVEKFFDEVSIQPGDELAKELERAIKDSALVCIRTDGYVSSPWCRKELALAKQYQRPMVVLDALSQLEQRSSPLLGNLPGIRVSVDAVDHGRLERVVNFIGLEVVRFLYANLQLTMLQAEGLVARDAILLTRPPEPRDLVGIINAQGESVSRSPVLLHPDPMLSFEEASEFEAFGARLVTPAGLWQKRLEKVQLGLSLSPGDPAELRALGLSLHVEDAARVIARQALAAGATLHYGGNLAEGSLTRALFEMIGAYNRDGLKLPALVNHTPWPWGEDVDIQWLAKRRTMLKADLARPPQDVLVFASSAGPGHVSRLAASVEGRYALGRSLQSMRRQLVGSTDARIVLGGKPHSFMGFLPGIVEETLLAIRSNQPLYVLGGFGGAARVVAQALEGSSPVELTRDYQQRLSSTYAETLEFYEQIRVSTPALELERIDYPEIVRELHAYGVAGVAHANGLDAAENDFLFRTGSVDAALYLIMKGLTARTGQRG